MNGIGYILFDAPISRTSAALLTKTLDVEQSKGAHEIDLAMNSPGGDVDAADSVVADMNRLHIEDGITFKAWNVKVVASAATLIFLDAQQRYTSQHAAFVFHAPYLMAAGSFGSATLRKDADRIDQIARAMRDTLVARTHLTPQQAQLYTTRTVMLSADDAMADGVVDGIGVLTPPTGLHVFVIRQKAKTPTAVTPTAASG